MDKEQDHIEIENKRLVSLGLLLLLILSIVFLISIYASRGIRIYGDRNIVDSTAPNHFENVSIGARSAIVWDIQNQKVLFEKNSEERLPLASITKVMMAITAMDLIPKDTVVTMNRKFLEEEGDSGLYVDERWELKDLMSLSLLVSSNDAATAIATTAGLSSNSDSIYDLEVGREEFLRKMNEKSLEIGMIQSSFYRENGLDRDGQNSGAYGSAKDVAKMFEYTIKNHPEILEATRHMSVDFKSLSNIAHNAKNTNQMVAKIPGLKGSKTGFTDLSGGNLAIVLDPAIGRPLVIVVLGSTYEKRFDDTLELAKRALSYMESGS